MIKLNEAVIVEGKYDKIALSNILDATIIPTNGFSIFKDKQKRKLISLLAEKKGLIVITDSDSAGMVIRSYLKKFCPVENIKNVYVPQIVGKERRKQKPSKAGYLGVEGLNKDILLEALNKSNIFGEDGEKCKKLTKADLYTVGLSGQNNSSDLRESFASFSGLPKGMSSSGFLDAVNAVYKFEDFFEAVEKWRFDTDKS